ncbi:MAG: hypothetical protein V1760_02305 [Candidatus Peregrinibacteria bacterium]
MSPATPSSPEKAGKKPTLTESVDELISKKRAERGEEGAREVQKSAEGVQHEVSEVMAGMEKPKEGISEKGEKKKDGDFKKSGAQAAIGKDEGKAAEEWKGVVLPSEEVMIRKIRTAIQLQIKVEWKKAKRLQKKLTSGEAQEYGSVIARIRKLKNILANLFTATFEYIKELYKKYFQPDGKRRPTEGVD